MGTLKGNAVLSLTDSNNRNFTKRLPNVNPLYMPNYGTDTAINPSAGASIKSACVALNGLTTSTLTQIDLESSIDITNM